MKTFYKNKEVFLKESTSTCPIFCKIKKIHTEAGSSFYEVEADGDIFHIAVESVQWIKQRKDLKVLDIEKINLAPLRIIDGKH